MSEQPGKQTDIPLIMQAFMSGENIIIKSEVSATVLVNVLTALLAYCTEAMLDKEKVLKDQDDNVNFLIGASLICSRVFQDCAYDKLDAGKNNCKGKVEFI